MDYFEEPSKGNGPALQDYWLILRRRKYYVVVAAVAVWIAFAVAAVRLPNIYRSEITILVEPPKVSTTYVQPMITSRIEERLSTIKEQILSRPNLERIIRENHLYNWPGTGPVSDAAIAAMRKDITVPVSGTSSFKVTYESRHPQTARDVVTRLAEFFIDENLRTREQQTTSTSEFLKAQLEEARKRLEGQEANLTQYKLQHMGDLPEQAQVNLKTLDRLQFLLQSSVEAMQRAQERKLTNDRLLSSLRSQVPSPSPSPWSAEVPPALSSIPEDPAAVQLRKYRAELADLSAHYKDDYPDIIQLRKKIARLEQQLAAQPPSPEAPPAAVAARAPENRSLDAYSLETKRRITELQTENESLENQIQRRAREQASLQAQIGYYQSKVDRAPQREQELAELMRDYEVTKANYKSLLERKLSSQTAENLEHKQKGEQFRIIDPAAIPERPSRPNRWLIFLAGLVLGPIFGAALAWGRDLLDQSLHTEADVARHLSLPVLASIPEIVRTPAPEEKPWYATARGTHLEITPRNRIHLLQESMRTAGAEAFFGQNRNGNGHNVRRLVLLTDPWSLASEQYRLLGLHVLNARHGFGCKSLLITSAAVNEGKTLATLNLALALVRERSAHVLIVDADLRKSGLDAFLPHKPAHGLADLLEGDGDYTSAILATPLTGLFMLPAGHISLNPVGHLGSARMADLLNHWEQDFDLVLIDSPPLLPVPDSLILAQLASRSLLVVRANATPHRAVQRALDGIPPEKRIGVLLNGVKEFSVNDRYYTEYYGRPPKRSYSTLIQRLKDEMNDE